MKRVIYLYKSGTLSRQDNSLILRDKKGYVSYLPIEQIDTIICFGEITLNKRTFSLLNTYRITILFFNYYGQYIGRFSPKQYIDARLLIQQIESYNNIEKRTNIAWIMIKSSLSNALSLLKYYNKKSFYLEFYINQINDIIHQLQSKPIDELLLLEAQAKKLYYDCFDIILQNNQYHFVKRTKHPPENEINAMMSYGYSLLYANYLSVLDRSRLYSQISYIHSLIKCNESLQFDLADILKPVLIDRLILSLCRHHQIKDSYFEFSKGRCYLNKEGAIFFVSKYEDYLKRTIKINNKYYSYRNLISREVHLLSNYIEDETKGYKPYIMRW